MRSPNNNKIKINPEIQKLWIQEAIKRIAEIRSGAVKPILGEEAIARVRQLLES